MKRLFFAMLVILAVSATTCKFHGEVNTPDGPVGLWTLFYNWTLPTDSGTCIEGASCKEKIWNPALEGNEGIYRNLPLAAAMAGFPVSYIEKFTSDDVNNYPYIMVVYTKEGIQKNTVTFVINDGDVLGKIDVKKAYNENWLAFYARGFRELMTLLPAEGSGPGLPPVVEDEVKVNEADIAELVRLINEYRVSSKLPEIPRSPLLDKVALAHVQDLERNHPETETCNMHSWSEPESGEWTPCCYTADQAQAECMWKKPKEISAFEAKGYEIAHGGPNAVVSPKSAIDGWKGSPEHNAVIINGEKWKDFKWQSLGVAISEHYAVVWFAVEADPKSTKAAAPAKPTADQIEAARVTCVDKINEYRKGLKLPALERDKAGEKCADDQAGKDQKANKAHENMGMCTGNATKSAQNTCPGYNSLADANGVCIQMMFDEGPPPKARCVGKCKTEHGHYINMTSKDYKKVACGFSINEKGEVWANHNFSN